MKKTIRLLGEDGLAHVRWIDHVERCSMLAAEQIEKVFLPDGTTDGTVKLKRYAPEECSSAMPSGRESSSGLTAGDMMRNAAGVVDTAKRREVYKMREKGQVVAASIRCYGRDRRDKPNVELVGNGVDRSMTRVENWAAASEANKAVTVLPGRILGLIELPANHIIFSEA